MDPVQVYFQEITKANIKQHTNAEVYSLSLLPEGYSMEGAQPTICSFPTQTNVSKPAENRLHVETTVVV